MAWGRSQVRPLWPCDLGDEIHEARMLPAADCRAQRRDAFAEIVQHFARRCSSTVFTPALGDQLGEPIRARAEPLDGYAQPGSRAPACARR